MSNLPNNHPEKPNNVGEVTGEKYPNPYYGVYPDAAGKSESKGTDDTSDGGIGCFALVAILMACVFAVFKKTGDLLPVWGLFPAAAAGAGLVAWRFGARARSRMDLRPGAVRLLRAWVFLSLAPVLFAMLYDPEGEGWRAFRWCSGPLAVVVILAVVKVYPLGNTAQSYFAVGALGVTLLSYLTLYLEPRRPWRSPWDVRGAPARYEASRPRLAAAMQGTRGYYGTLEWGQESIPFDLQMTVDPSGSSASGSITFLSLRTTRMLSGAVASTENGTAVMLLTESPGKSSPPPLQIPAGIRYQFKLADGSTAGTFEGRWKYGRVSSGACTLVADPARAVTAPAAQTAVPPAATRAETPAVTRAVPADSVEHVPAPGISLVAPRSWRKYEVTGLALVLAAPTGPARVSLTLSRGSPDATVEDALRELPRVLAGRIPGFALDRAEVVGLRGERVVRTTYTATADGKTTRVMNVAILRPDNVVAFDYAAPQEDYDRYAEDANRMFISLMVAK